jgi:Nucleotidyltransferase of unknown function (DUF6036)
MSAKDRPPEPWASFLAALDAVVGTPVEIHCLGGFMVEHAYRIQRDTPTEDLDFLSAIDIAHSAPINIESLAGKGTAFHRQHKMYVQYVGISTPPCDYRQRLVAVYPQVRWKNLRLFGLEAHDLALSKIERNNRRDSQDVRGLAQAGLIDPDILDSRYHQEVRPYLLSKFEWHDGTLKRWLEAIREIRADLESPASAEDDTSTGKGD